MREKLTPKQRRFAKLVAQGRPYSDAYRAAYDAESCSPHTIHVEASKLAQRPDVANSIQAEIERESMLDRRRGQQWREAIDAVAWEIMHDSTAKPGDRLQAAKLGGSQTHVQAFREQGSEEPNVLTDLAAAIAELMGEIEQAGIVIDIEAASVNESESLPPCPLPRVGKLL
jgi:hypothetical protein